MNQNLVSTTLSAEDLAAINAALETVQTKLSAHFRPLNEEERRGLHKMAERALPYAEISLEIARQHPEKLPPGISLEEYERDWTLYRQLVPLQLQCQQLLTLLEDGLMAARSDLMVSFVDIYSFLRRFDNDPALRAAVDRMSVFFARTKKTPGQPTPTPAP